MGTITRHAGAPFARGETSSAADLEFDIKSCYSEFNGNITDANLSATTPINGAALRNDSLSDSSFSTTPADLLETSRMARRGYVSTSSSADSLTSVSGFVVADVPGISYITVTPYAVTDVVVARFSATFQQALPTEGIWSWLFSINGTDTDIITTSTLSDFTVGVRARQVTCQWAFTAAAISPITIVPRHLRWLGGSSAAAAFSGTRVFSVTVLPG